MAALQHIYRALKPGGFFAFFENNPWNPGTRWIMSRIPFDRDAVLLAHREARTLLRNAGFTLVGKSRFLFFYPHGLSVFRFSEQYLSSIPFGAQYLVLAQKPETTDA